MGERRLRATKASGRTEIPAIIRDTDDDDNNASDPDLHTRPDGSPEAAGSAYEAYPPTSTPFPHPAMAGGADNSTTEFEKKDLR